MNDRFEDAVRDALHGLPAETGEIPTYHEAWQRGRRRRLVKRSALAAAGVLVLLAALSVNLGRLPGSSSTEVDDVATGAEFATPVFEPTPLATTSPVAPPAEADLPTPPSLEIPTAVVPAPAPTVEVVPPATVAPAPTATVTNPAPTAAPAATAVPDAPTVAPIVPEPEPTPEPTVDVSPEQEEQGQATLAVPEPEAADPSDAAGTAQQPADPGSPDAPAPDTDEPAFTTAVAGADAALLTGAARGVALPCDIDADGIADATCELLVGYPCTGEGDVEPGYSAIDTDSDATPDTCVAIGTTQCDTTGDGAGDTPCIIELNPPSGEDLNNDG